MWGRVVLWAALLALSACATDIDLTAQSGPVTARGQDRLMLTPSNGGVAIAPTDLQPGDILLSSTQALPSLGIRLLTLAPVSHAALYLGDGAIAEAVGQGVRIRTTQAFIDGESTIAAFRHPGMTETQAAAIQAFAQRHDGKKYNTAGIVMQVPMDEVRPAEDLLIWRDPADGSRHATRITGGHCKAQWKADWALRWFALGVDYEMSGKDLIDSVRLSSAICRVLYLIR